jgi:hypothetical protein
VPTIRVKQIHTMNIGELQAAATAGFTTRHSEMAQETTNLGAHVSSTAGEGTVPAVQGSDTVHLSAAAREAFLQREQTLFPVRPLPSPSEFAVLLNRLASGTAAESTETLIDDLARLFGQLTHNLPPLSAGAAPAPPDSAAAAVALLARWPGLPAPERAAGAKEAVVLIRQLLEAATGAGHGASSTNDVSPVDRAVVALLVAALRGGAGALPGERAVAQSLPVALLSLLAESRPPRRRSKVKARRRPEDSDEEEEPPAGYESSPRLR